MVTLNQSTFWIMNSQILSRKLSRKNLEYEIVPPHQHRRNAAERAIRKFKKYILSGFAMFQYFKKHEMEGNTNFQQMSSENLALTTYAAISRGTCNESFFKKILSNINTDKVQLLCQHTNLELYEILDNTTNNNTIHLLSRKSPYRNAECG